MTTAADLQGLRHRRKQRQVMYPQLHTMSVDNFVENPWKARKSLYVTTTLTNCLKTRHMVFQ